MLHANLSGLTHLKYAPKSKKTSVEQKDVLGNF